MAYKSKNFPSNIMAEEKYRSGATISNKSISDKVRYLNKQYKKLLDKKGNLTNYTIFNDYGIKAEMLNREIARRIALDKGEDISDYKNFERAIKEYGFIDIIDYKTGNIVFKTTGYSNFTQEEKIKFLGIRDAMVKNWAMSEKRFAQFQKEARGYAGRESFLKNHPNMPEDIFVKLDFFFKSPEWQRIRKSVPYTESIEEIIQKVQGAMSDYENLGQFTDRQTRNRIIRDLRNAQSVTDFIKMYM